MASTNRPTINSHRDLIVWQKSMDYVDFVYDLAERFPERERFGLWSQMTRSAVSVATNISEGHGRGSRKDSAHFLTMSRSSLMETDTLIAVAVRRKYATPEDARRAFEQIEEISKMPIALRRRLVGDWEAPSLKPETCNLKPLNSRRLAPRSRSQGSSR